MAHYKRPRVTVATVVEDNGRFLLVEEVIGGRRCFNQPAGHLEYGESLLAAAKRETLEESGYHIDPVALVGIYQWQAPQFSKRYVRFTFVGVNARHAPEAPLDAGIVQAHWLTPAELDASTIPPRSELVQRSIHDYLSGRRFPLDLIYPLDPL
jgi:8-oxo-dGTP pyrophosphatase MutT (NUDIX family)